MINDIVKAGSFIEFNGFSDFTCFFFRVKLLFLAVRVILEAKNKENHSIWERIEAKY
jgi:hypothetical protein